MQPNADQRDLGFVDENKTSEELHRWIREGSERFVGNPEVIHVGTERISTVQAGFSSLTSE
jgi:hypothetical protein